jgi:hypothetical protein
MADYRRWYIPGATSFFTIVTQDRVTVFRDPQAVHLLGDVMRKVRTRSPFRTLAIVVLPDWPWSSFSRHVALGQYLPDWGTTEPAMPAQTPPE